MRFTSYSLLCRSERAASQYSRECREPNSACLEDTLLIALQNSGQQTQPAVAKIAAQIVSRLAHLRTHHNAEIQSIGRRSSAHPLEPLKRCLRVISPKDGRESCLSERKSRVVLSH